MSYKFFSPYYILSQASEDAKKMVDEERAFARAEIDNARAAVQRVEEALQEHERMSRATVKQVPLDVFLPYLQNYLYVKSCWICLIQSL